MRESRRHAAADDVDTAHAEGLQAIRCGHGEGTGLRQRRSIRAAAIPQVFLIDGKLTTLFVQPGQRHRIVQVLDIQHQVGGAGIAISIGQGVSERLSPGSPTMQIEEVRV